MAHARQRLIISNLYTDASTISAQLLCIIVFIVLSADPQKEKGSGDLGANSLVQFAVEFACPNQITGLGHEKNFSFSGFSS